MTATNSLFTVNVEIFAWGLFSLNSQSRNFPRTYPPRELFGYTSDKVISPMEIIILGAKCYVFMLCLTYSG